MSAPNRFRSSVPRPARWPICDRRVAAGWIVTGRNHGSILQAEGVTRAEAWRKLCEQARLAGLTDPPVGGASRDRLAACLALIGAVVGWVVPLVVKGVVPGASATLYEHAESVLCPLLACFGGGIGFACGVMATARPALSSVGRTEKPGWEG